MHRVFLSFLLLLIGSPAYAALTVTAPVGASAPPFVIVENIGLVYASTTGDSFKTYDLQQEVKNRESQLGRQIDLPSDLHILIPCTGSYQCEVLSGSLTDLQDQKVQLQPPAPVSRDWVPRSFFGPSIVDTTGQVVSSAVVSFDGYTKTSGLSGPQIVGSAYLPQNQRQITMAVFAQGYDLKVVSFELTDEQLTGDVDNIPAGSSDIVLEPLPNQVHSVVFHNRSTRGIFDDYQDLGGSYRQDPAGVYHYFYQVLSTVDDGSNNVERYVADIPLIGSIPEELGINKYDPQSGLLAMAPVDESDVPITVPRIKSDLQLTGLQARVVPPHEPTTDEGEFDPKTAALIAIIVIGILIFVTIRIVIYLLNQQRKLEAQIVAEKKIADRELARKVEKATLNTRYFEQLQTCERLTAHKNCNEASATQLRKLRKQILQLVNFVIKTLDDQRNLNENLSRIKADRRIALSDLDSYLAHQKYDLAAQAKARVENLNSLREDLDSTIADLNTVIAEKRSLLSELFDMLSRTNDRTNDLVHNVEVSTSINELAAQTVELMSKVESSLSSDVKTAQGVVTEMDERIKAAENVGVDNADVGAMQRFLADQKKRS